MKKPKKNIINLMQVIKHATKENEKLGTEI